MIPLTIKAIKKWLSKLLFPASLVFFTLGFYQLHEVPSPVTFKQALQDAEYVASLNPNWIVFEAEGLSMNPHYSNNALVVVEKTDYDKLEPGMVVVYKDAEGDYVGHILQEKTDKGFIARGYNNPEEDPGLVTPSNLVGVLFATFHYSSYSRDELPRHDIIYGKEFKLEYNYNNFQDKGQTSGQA